MIHIPQGKRKTNTGLIGRKNGWKIPIIKDPKEGSIKAGKELHEEYSKNLPGKILHEITFAA
jgi:hypothetical protein